MIQKTYVVSSEIELLKMIDWMNADLSYLYARSKLAQVYLSRFARDEAANLLALFKKMAPDVKIVGMSLYGDPFVRLNADKLIKFSFCFFTESDVAVLEYDCEEHALQEVVADFRRRLGSIPSVAGVLVLGSGFRLETSRFMDSVSVGYEGIPFFGAMSNINTQDVADGSPYVLGNNRVIAFGVVMAILSGRSLHVYAESLFNWTPIGKPMLAKSAPLLQDGSGDSAVATIDGLPATLIYKKYLNVEPDAHFVSNICEFPLVVERNGYIMPRVPCGYTHKGELMLMGDIRDGELVRFTYGKKDEILKKSEEASLRMGDFAPEAIFLFVCANRAIFLKEQAAEEINYFHRVNSSVVYCHGFSELFRYRGQGGVFNSQLVTVGLREGELPRSRFSPADFAGISFTSPGGARPDSVAVPSHAVRDESSRTVLDRAAGVTIPLAERLVTFLEATTSDLNKVNRELERMTLAANAANEAKSTFLSNMSHEIRTPINAVLGLDEMILRESTEAPIRGYAQDIQSSGRTLLSIINDILDFSKIEAGKMELVPADYDLSSMISDLVNMLGPRAKTKGLEFIVNVDREMPYQLYGDETRVKQCVLNILTNAVKYTPKGSVTMSFSYCKQDAGHILLTVRVVDTGIGIKDEDRKRLFSPFERIEESRNRSIEGTGLGMSIVKGLLSMMGSQIDVSSVYGQGSDFSFTVSQKVRDWAPIGDYEQTHARAMRRSEGYRESFQAPDAHILIVDDTPMNLTVMRGLLKKTRIRIDTAEDGMRALEMARHTPYHLVFVDHLMPKMDGIQMLHALRKDASSRNQHTVCIVLTANAVSGAKEMYLKEGFEAYLSKPVDGSLLEAALRTYLPKELVILPGQAGFISQPQPSGGAASSGGDADALFAELFGIDAGAAVKNCGGRDVFMDAVKNFYDAIPTKASVIEAYANARSLREYTVQVHALKSSARLIGAAKLSADAAYLEQCGNAGNEAEVASRTPALLRDYRAYRGRLAPLCGGTREASAPRLPDIPADKLAEALGALKEVVTAFDFDSADSIIRQLDAYQMPPDFAATYAQIKEKLLAVDQAALLALLPS